MWTCIRLQLYTQTILTACCLVSSTDRDVSERHIYSYVSVTDILHLTLSTLFWLEIEMIRKIPTHSHPGFKQTARIILWMMCDSGRQCRKHHNKFKRQLWQHASAEHTLTVLPMRANVRRWGNILQVELTVLKTNVNVLWQTLGRLVLYLSN